MTEHDLFGFVVNAACLGINLYFYRIAKNSISVFVAGMNFLACLGLLLGVPNCD